MTAAAGREPRPMTPDELDRFRKSVALIGNDADTYGDWWSNHTAMRLLATLDAEKARVRLLMEQGSGDGLEDGSFTLPASVAREIVEP